MELIPILSLIVLVATISTFILAIGAYVLYKVRESKGRRAPAPMPQAVEAELFAPQTRMMQGEMHGSQGRPIPASEGSAYVEAAAKQGRAGYSQERSYPQQPTNSRSQQDYYSNGNGTHEETAADERSDKKFMKYTSEGYVPVSKINKTGENLKWR
ncbi:MAG: hypothetical protein ACM34K_06980 [Bacillota bacterium]